MSSLQQGDSVQDVLILTAGGTGREIYDLLGCNSRYNPIGFLDDASPDIRVKGPLSAWGQYNHCQFISGLGSYKKMPFRRQFLSGVPLERFTSFCSPLALVYPSAQLHAETTVIFPYAVIAANAALAEHTFVYHHAVISHDVSIGAYSMVSNHACISGNVQIGEACYIGANATINEGMSIGHNSIVASGATVIHSVPDNSIYIRPHHVLRNQYS
jgi:sugar O-acyltransferase (sialic acid O-acetyltransferase NeuD family)